MWFRAVGRVTFPIWFFLAGYAKGSKFSFSLLAYAVLVHIGNVAAFYPVFPLNALISIMCCRAFVAFLQKKGPDFIYKNLWAILIIIIIWHIPLTILFEYGGLAILYALLGHIIRLKNDGIMPAMEVEEKKRNKDKAIFVIAVLLFIFVQQTDFDFNLMQFLFVAVGTTFTVYKLYTFNVKEIQNSLLHFKAVRFTILCLSRYSLEYYFYHRVGLQFLSLLFVPSHEHIFQWVN